tara:strand:- start:562 stop:744 length:183 start_codon:yes stop_codon:yes gene_type:complete
MDILKTKAMEEKHAIRILDEAYSSVMSLVRSDDDHETINLIQPILDKIDEIQNDIENLNN